MYPPCQQPWLENVPLIDDFPIYKPPIIPIATFDCQRVGKFPDFGQT